MSNDESRAGRGHEHLAWWERHALILAIGIVGALVAIYAGVLLAYLWPIDSLTVGASGTFGDSFGALTAFFSGLAFAVVAVSLHLQRKDLGLAQQEFRDTRAQMERLQRENNFFQLLRTHMEIVANTKVAGAIMVSFVQSYGDDDARTIHASVVPSRTDTTPTREHIEVSGRACFSTLWRELTKFFEVHDRVASENAKSAKTLTTFRRPQDSLIAAYADFLEWRQHDLANYLQSVFWMLRYLADAGFAEEEKANVLAYCAHAVVTE